jgi:uncharacterized phosphosugar-binding protein
MSSTGAVASYLSHLSSLLHQVATQDTVPNGPIERASELITSAFTQNRLLHLFGCGHSHLLALELFYRAGGFASVNPILTDDLMLHKSASASTKHERQSGQAQALADQHNLTAGDVLICISNSGANVVAIELARLARQRGVSVIALVSSKHAASPECRANIAGDSGMPENLTHCSDVVLDNHGQPGDAATSAGSCDGHDYLMGATSTVIGATLLHAVALRAAERMIQNGRAPDVFISANVKGGDAHNDTLIAKYIDRVESL